MKIQKVNIQNKLNQFSDYWNPRIVGELNDQHVKLAKFKGEFVRHRHPQEDEMFLVIHGSLRIEMDENNIILNEGEFIVIPKGTYHKPVAENEVHILLFEPASTLNTGDVRNDLTKDKIAKI